MSEVVILTSDDLNQRVYDAVAKALQGLMPQHQKSSEEYITRKQASERLKVSLPTIHAYINKGVLIPYKIEGRTLFKAVEVEEAISKQYISKYKHKMGW